MSISPASLVVLAGAVPLAGNGEVDPGYLSILGSLNQLHIAGFHFQIQIAYHLVGNGFPVGGKVLLAAASNAVCPNHNTAALGSHFSALMVTEPLMAWAEVMVSWLPSTEKFSPVVLLEKV